VELLDYLNSEALKEINLLLNLMAYRNRLGREKIEKKLIELLSFVQNAKRSSEND